ncbi:MAG: hypothetical protein SPK09_04470 [Porphyromonas sp.]|nr:hypothetical protein [Porphyromonas sp.]
MTLRSVRRELVALGLGAGILLAYSWTTAEQPEAAAAIALGNTLPTMKITNERSTRDTDGLASGKSYKLLHFWAAYDAESRASNVAYAQSLTGSETIVYQSISLDVDAEVYRQTLALDGVDVHGQVLADAQWRDALAEQYGQRGGIRSVLIDAEGTVLLVNPSTAELEQFVRTN